MVSMRAIPAVQRSSAQTQERQDEQNDYNQADQIDQTIHSFLPRDNNFE